MWTTTNCWHFLFISRPSHITGAFDRLRSEIGEHAPEARQFVIVNALW
jgi:hypothetical protein